MTSISSVAQSSSKDVNILDAISVPSPEVYAALKMEDYTSVSNNGSGNLNTNLFTLTAEGQSLPLNLSYDLQGVRASEVASFVGLGWNLSFGASLVRVVTGLPDERQRGFLLEPELSLLVADYINNGSIEGLSSEEISRLASAVSGGFYDAGPDAFKYSVGGVSGQFRFDASGGIRQQPITNIRVKKHPRLEWIELTDPNGMIWRFGGRDASGDLAIDQTNVDVPVGGGIDDATATRYTKWHLTSMRDAAGHVFFTADYRPSHFISEQSKACRDQRRTVACQGTTQDGIERQAEACGTTPQTGSKDEKTGSYYDRVYNNTWVPTELLNPATGRKLSFSYAGPRVDVGAVQANVGATPVEALRLKQVSYFDGDLTITKELGQAYTSTGRPAVGDDDWYDRRLLLMGITTLPGGGGTVFNVEKFTYNYEKATDGSYLSPSRLSPFTDFWGYFNSLAQRSVEYTKRNPREDSYIYNDESKALQIRAGTFTNGLSRSANLEGSRQGTLASYEDGRGTRIEYDYELHEVASYIATKADEPESYLYDGLYVCNNGDGDCTQCECYDVDNPKSSIWPYWPFSSTDTLGCNVADADPNQADKTLILDPDLDYRFEIKIQRFARDNREYNYRNVQCSEGTGVLRPGTDLSNLEGYLELVDFTDSRPRRFNLEFGTDKPTDNPVPGPPKLKTVHEYGLKELFPNIVPKQSSGMYEIKASLFSGYGSAWVEVYATEQLGEGGRFADRTVGGVRLKSTQTEDLISGKISTTRFSYVEERGGKLSSGRLLREPVTGYSATQPAFDGTGSFCSVLTTSSAPTNAILSFQGTHVEYTAITSEQVEVDRGYTTERYREPEINVVGNASSQSIVSTFGSVYNPKEGELLERTAYSSANKVVESKRYTWLSQPNSAHFLQPERMVTALESWFCAVNLTVDPRFGPSSCIYQPKKGNSGKQVVSGAVWPNVEVAHTLYSVEEERDGVSWTTNYNYAPAKPYSVLLSEIKTDESTGIAQQTVYTPAVYSEDAGLQASARATNQVSLVERTTRQYRASGRGSLLQTSAEELRLRGFDGAGALSSRTDGEGTVLRPYQTLRYGADAEESILTATYEAYTPFGAPSSVVRYDDEAPVEIKYDVDRPKSISYLNFLKSATYHGTSLRAKTTTSEQGQTVSYAYDPIGRLKTVTEREGKRINNYTYASYSEAGSNKQNWTEQVVSVTPTVSSAIKDLKTRTYYDGWRSPIQTIHVNQLDGGGDRLENFGYDNYGRLLQKYEPYGRAASSTAYRAPAPGLRADATYSYEPNPLDRVTATEVPYWGSTSTAYGNGLTSGNFRVATTDEEGYATFEETDVFGRSTVRGSTAADGYRTESEYDALGRLAKVYRAGKQSASPGLTLAYGYDNFGRLTSKTVPEEGATAYRFDDRDRLTAEQTPRSRVGGFTRGYRYDAYGALEGTGQLPALPADGNAVPAFTTDESIVEYGRGAQAADFGRVTENIGRYATGGSSYTTSSEYDAYGRLRATATDDGSTAGVASATLAYDQLDNLTSNRETVAGAGGRRATVEHTMAYNVYGYHDADTYAADGGASTTVARTYDDHDWLARKELGFGAGAAGAPWQTVDYTYYLQGALFLIGDSGPSPAGYFPVELGERAESPPLADPQREPGAGAGGPGVQEPQIPGLAIRLPLPPSGPPVAGSPLGARATASGPRASAALAVGRDAPLFHQIILRTYGHPDLENAGRRDGRVSWTSTRLGRGVPFDVAYAYDEAKDNVLAGSTTAWRRGAAFNRRTYEGVGAYATAYEYAGGRAGLHKLQRIERWQPTGPELDAPRVLADDLDFAFGSGANATRVTGVTDEATGPGPAGGTADGLYGVPAGQSALAYDRAGAMTAAPGVTFAYDGSGMVAEAGVNGGVTENFNLFSGQRTGFRGPDGATVKRYGSLELRGGAPDRYYFGDGYYDFAEGRFVYSIADHLGTPRVWFTDVNGDGVIRAEDDVLETRTHYPFGMFAFGTKAEGYESDRRDYTGHETVGVTDEQSSRYQAVVDMQARYFIPGLGIFASVDPLASEMPEYSPYAYGFSDPVNFTDPTGMAPCPPGAECPGSTDNKGYVRDPSDSEAGGSVGMALARASFFVLDNFTPLNAVDNAIADFQSAETTGERVGAVVAGVGSVVTTTRGGKTGKGARGFGDGRSTNSATSRQALRKAKDSNGVPRSQQPDRTIKPGTPEGRAAGLDTRNVAQHEFTNSRGDKVSIRQDKPAKYGDGGKGDQGSHYNAGEAGKKLPQHHNYPKP